MVIELGAGTHYHDVPRVNTSKEWSTDRNSNAVHLETTLLQKPIKGSDDAKQKHKALVKFVTRTWVSTLPAFLCFLGTNACPYVFACGSTGPSPCLA